MGQSVSQSVSVNQSIHKIKKKLSTLMVSRFLHACSVCFFQLLPICLLKLINSEKLTFSLNCYRINDLQCMVIVDKAVFCVPTSFQAVHL